MDGPLREAGFDGAQVSKLVQLTGPSGSHPGFTYSDLTQRLLPLLVLDAYPSVALSFERAVVLVKAMHPTPAFKDGAN